MTLAQLGHVVVVGGGLAAARSCGQLREQGHAGRITLVTAETHLPYDRPPLSKDVLIGEASTPPRCGSTTTHSPSTYGPESGPPACVRPSGFW